MTPEQEFYAHNDSYTRPKPEPGLDPRINEELAKLGGKCAYGDDRFQIKFAGNLTKKGVREFPDGEIVSGNVTKYLHKFSKVTNWQYTDLNGTVHEVSSSDQLPPQSEIKGFPVGVPKIYALGQLRFVLEVKFTLEELVKLGKYPAPDSIEGRNYGRDDMNRIIDVYPESRGIYESRLVFEDAEGEFLRPTMDWFNEIFKPDFWEGMNYGLDLLQEIDQKRLVEKEARQADAVTHRNRTIGDQIMSDIERAPIGRVFSLPNKLLKKL